MTKAMIQEATRGTILPVDGPLRLLLGGRTTKLEGWKNVDLYDGEGVDIRADASKLFMVKDHAVSEIYASHILEHFSHTKTVDVLKEWHRVLKPGGKAYISVPDFDAMIKLYHTFGFSEFIRNMLYGDQGYDLAYHYTAFTFRTLAVDCIKAGFSDIKELEKMPYGIKDCSTNVDTLTLKPISVSIEAIA